ncbi:NADPH:quinone reductase [Maublancomyces gigas]|uniref:NADPH:quinone reductase n=1 Tax=Discina gigas TaxID=1032678 RepID=A0ABR3GES0_9PEZI
MSSAIPKTQTAVQIEAYGGVEVLQLKKDAPVPEIKPTELLIKNEYAGINFIDIYFRNGLYSVPAFPYTLGREAEGRVAAIGDSVTGYKVGDRVAYIGASAQAEYTALEPLHVAQVPAGVEGGVAAASLLQGLTALTMVRESYPVQKGDFILVHAAAGGVGLWLCQFVRAIGAYAIATASTDKKLQLAKENGAEFTINYSTEDWVSRVLEITGKKGVAAVFDGVGASTFEGDLEVLARKGSLVSFGNASGPVPPFAIARLAAKNLKVLRPQLFGYIVTREEFESYAGEILELIAAGKVNVKIHEVYPLADVARAQTDIESRGTTGKLILKI